MDGFWRALRVCNKGKIGEQSTTALDNQYHCSAASTFYFNRRFLLPHYIGALGASEPRIRFRSRREDQILHQLRNRKVLLSNPFPVSLTSVARANFTPHIHSRYLSLSARALPGHTTRLTTPVSATSSKTMLLTRFSLRVMRHIQSFSENARSSIDTHAFGSKLTNLRKKISPSYSYSEPAEYSPKQERGNFRPYK